MLIQEQLPWTHIDDEHLSIFKAIGVDYVTINGPPPDLKDGVDRGDFWQEVSRRVDSHGMKLDNVGMNCWDEISLASAGSGSEDRCVVHNDSELRCCRNPNLGL